MNVQEASGPQARTRFRGLLSTPGKRRSAWSLAGFVGNAVLTFVAVVATTRALGRDTYGVYVGLASYVGLVAPFATFGTGQTLMQRVSSDRSAFSRSLGSLLATFFIIGVPLFAVALGLASAVVPQYPLSTVALLAAVEFLGLGLLAASGDACIALGRHAALATHFVGVAAARAAAALALWRTGGTDVQDLAVYQLIAMTVVAVALVGWLLTNGAPHFDRADLRDSWRVGRQFAFGRVADTVMTNVDRTMLLRGGFEGDAGLYGAGVRMISYALLPARSVLVAGRAKFFEAGAKSIEGAVEHGRRLARPALALTIGGTVAAIAGTPLVVRLFGDGFDDTLWVVVAMAGFPVVRTLQMLVGNVLTGSGYQSFRSWAQFAAAVGNVALNLVLIPRYQWQGAVIATYATEAGFLAAIVWGLALRRRRATASVH